MLGEDVQRRYLHVERSVTRPECAFDRDPSVGRRNSVALHRHVDPARREREPPHRRCPHAADQRDAVHASDATAAGVTRALRLRQKSSSGFGASGSCFGAFLNVDAV